MPRTARPREPVAVLFESGKAKLTGRLPELEDELAGLAYGGAIRGREGARTGPTR